MQSGLYKITLTEAKNIQINYTTVAPTCFFYCEVLLIFRCNVKDGATGCDLCNGKINYTYEVDFLNLNKSDVTTIKRSIYGWLAVLTFNNKDSKIVTIPLKFANSIQNNNTSASYSTKITNFDLTNKKMVSFNPIPLPWILETGYWNDSNYWLDNENWID